MNVRDLTIELRPRSGWEAVDLGNALAKQHYRNLLRIGFRGFAIPVLLLTLISWPIPWLLPILLWFFKPVLDRFYLYYLSRSIFGQDVTVAETLKQWRSLGFRGSLSLLTLRRFSPFRAMTMPVTDLENLTRKERGTRAAIITRVGGGTAFGICLGGLWLEFVALMSVAILAVMFIPEGQNPNWYEFTRWFREGLVGPTLLTLAYGLLYAVIIALLEPFYLASGFVLYLNSRTRQEAWDIELRFRELATRVSKTRVTKSSPESQTRQSKALGPVVIVLVSLLFLLSSDPLPAQSVAAPSPQEVLVEVLQDEDFAHHTRTYKEWVPDENSWLEGFWDWVEGLNGNASSTSQKDGGIIAEGFFFILGVLALTLLVLLIGILFFNLIRNRRALRGVKTPPKLRRPPPSVVMGMAVTPESLPADILAEARRIWAEGQSRAALSLLYRGALTHCIAKLEIQIEASDTESECLQRVSSMAAPETDSYFRFLSEQWMKAAYSQRMVAQSDFETLCTTWPFPPR